VNIPRKTLVPDDQVGLPQGRLGGDAAHIDVDALGARRPAQRGAGLLHLLARVGEPLQPHPGLQHTGRRGGPYHRLAGPRRRLNKAPLAGLQPLYRLALVVPEIDHQAARRDAAA
jgi:hypothetical protein